jgi:hypothetical protein
MVRRRSTVRFRNGAPLKDQVKSSLDSSHLTLRMGVVAVLGGIWEIVFFRADGAHLVGPPGSADRCQAPRREPEACRTVASRRAFKRVSPVAIQHEIIIRREHMSEPWPRKS